MAYTVSARAGYEGGPDPAADGLYTRRGARKYLTRAERQRLLATCGGQPGADKLLALTLLWTGARVSEVLALAPQAFEIDAGVVALRTLKQRRPVTREVPVPPALMAVLEARFGLRAAQAAGDTRRLWPCSQVTAWRHVKALLAAAGIHGDHACPRGLRHGFGVGTLQSGAPITLPQRWMGHAKLKTTAIYTAVIDPEERGFAEAFFAWSGGARGVTSDERTFSAAMVSALKAVARMKGDSAIAWLELLNESTRDDRHPPEAKSQQEWKLAER